MSLATTLLGRIRADGIGAITREEAEAVAVLLDLDEHLGYEQDPNYPDNWHCRGHHCGQRFGAPHLDDCEIAAALALLRRS